MSMSSSVRPPRGAGAQRLEEGVGVLGEEGVAEPAVGELAGQLEVARAEGGHVHGHVGRREHRAQRPARAVRQWQLVDPPVVATLSPRATARTISIVSRVAVTGAVNLTPCQPSMTCGPLVPMPSRNRPPERRCIAIADIASSAGEREPSWTMPVASPIVDVLAARKASGVKASAPHTSGTHTDEAPSRSALDDELDVLRDADPTAEGDSHLTNAYRPPRTVVPSMSS